MESPIARDGVEVISSLLSPAEVAALLHHLTSCEFNRGRAGSRHLMRDNEVAALARDPRLVGLANRILATTAIPFRATLFDKSSKTNWLVAWHQDTALPLREKYDREGWGPWSIKDGIHYAHAPAWALRQVIALRVHLDDSTSENGPLRVLPETHSMGVLSDDEVSALASTRESMECTVDLGGVIAMRPLVVHASSKTKSLSPRRVLHMEYASRSLMESDIKLAVA